jgi:acyl-coenzyme A thioesterase PaaI-like protein
MTVSASSQDPVMVVQRRHHVTSSTASDDILITNNNNATTATTTPTRDIAWPSWIDDVRRESGEALVVPEWEEHYPTTTSSDTDNDNDDDDMNVTFRSKHGWHGRDYMHDPTSPVRIVEYYIMFGSQGGMGTTLTGWVYFSERAESHRGYCHGGSMCSVLDDAIGWCAFCVTGKCRPWSGYTVQVNTRLQKPIAVRSCLVVRAVVIAIERRKVSVQVKLYSPVDDVVHAQGDGLVVLNRGVMPCYSRESTSSFMSDDFSTE